MVYERCNRKIAEPDLFFSWPLFYRKLLSCPRAGGEFWYRPGCSFGGFKGAAGNPVLHVAIEATSTTPASMVASALPAMA